MLCYLQTFKNPDVLSFCLFLKFKGEVFTFVNIVITKHPKLFKFLLFTSKEKKKKEKKKKRKKKCKKQSKKL